MIESWGPGRGDLRERLCEPKWSRASEAAGAPPPDRPFVPSRYVSWITVAELGGAEDEYDELFEPGATVVKQLCR